LDGPRFDGLSFDNDVRLLLFQEFVAAGEPPSAESLAARMHRPVAELRAALERLAAGKAIVLQPESREILMANPLSAVPTPFRVRSVGRKPHQGRSFFGACVWDAMGIVALLQLGCHDYGDAVLDTSCGCCGEAMALTFRDGEPLPAQGVIHFAIPARRWWENIVFT
jgi:hypothetical protein